MKSKKDSLIDHTEQRLNERYGIKYTQALRENLIHQLRNNKAELIAKQSLRVSVWEVYYEVKLNEIINHDIAKVGPTKIRFVYDKQRKTLVTVLPLNEIE